jgi:UDP-N-acetylmuramyl pentapeptide phosphotransferase/UDP-N-acetylglucosamine-1-phosphate transferase
MGRAFAHDGKLSAGKPRGAGIIFIFTFAIAALLFAQMNVEIAIYLVLIIVEMLTGYFDDAAEKPWGELLKGALDLAVAVVVAMVYLHYNTSDIVIALLGMNFGSTVMIFFPFDVCGNSSTILFFKKSSVISGNILFSINLVIKVLLPLRTGPTIPI